jgi:hypothetical protein
MVRGFILSLAATGLLLSGCNESTAPQPAAPQTTSKEGGVKVRAPGVNVDVNRDGSQKKVDVNVDVNK